MAIETGAANIIAAMGRGQPFFIGRNGSTELESIQHYMECNKYKLPYHPGIIRRLQKVSGIWPPTPDNFELWVKDYLLSLSSIQGIAAGWYQPLAEYEAHLLKTMCPSAFQMPLRSLEPYYVEPPLRWTLGLKGKRVAVVSSFAETIAKQVQKGNVWPEGDILPSDTEWIPIRTFFPMEISEGDAATSWPPEIKSWLHAVDRVVGQVLESGAQVALVGCGALAMSIGARLFQRGISVVLMGGAIQVLFGIKGTRWETHPVISTLWNYDWVWPDASEKPPAASKIEHACYW